MNKIFVILGMTIIGSTVWGMQPAAQVKIDKIINNSFDEAYIIIPGTQREAEILRKRGGTLPEVEDLNMSRRQFTLPIFKIQEAYVIHNQDKTTEPLILNVEPGTHGLYCKKD